MRTRFSISAKIAVLVLAIVLVTIGAVSVITFQLSRATLKERYLHELNVLADHKSQRLNAWLTETQLRLETATSVLANNQTGVFVRQPGGETTIDKARLEQHLMNLNSNFGFANMLLLSTDGRIIYSLHRNRLEDSEGQTFSDLDGKVLAEARKGTTFSDVYNNGQQYVLLAASPLHDIEGRLAGIMVAATSMENTFSMLQDSAGMGYSGETILARQQSNKITVQNPLRNDPLATLRREMYMDQSENKAVQAAVAQQQGYGQDIDYRKKTVLAAWRPVPATGWGLVVKIDEDEIYQPVDRLRTFITAAAVGILLFSALLILVFTNILVRPLLQLKQRIELLSKGILPENIKVRSSDEIGLMTHTVNQFVNGLKRTVVFASRIGEGDTKAEFTPLSEQDNLGMALINMRNNLEANARADEHRNWIIRGEAEVGEILRRHTDLAPLGDEMLAYLVTKIEAVQGAFYVVEQAGPDSTPIIELRNSFAYNRKKYLQAQFKAGEGLVGQAVLEKEAILRTEIPPDYVTITSGLLGDRRPGCILIMPLIANDQVNGVLELAGLERFTPQQIQFIEEVSHILARTLFNIQVNLRTRRLLEASQQMSYELQQQQEELRQNAEEMAATQEDLKRTNLRLAEQIDEVNRTQKRMQVLLENASEVITIYEADEHIRYISPSVTKILGYSSDELLRSGLRAKTHPDFVPAVDHMFRQVLAQPGARQMVQFQVMNAQGEFIWMEAVGTNLLHDPAINGLVLNMRDISERKQAEREARMRGQMQALSENSPDLITRVNREGRFFYINPVIETYTRLKPSFFLGRSIADQDFKDHSVFRAWRSMCEAVIANECKVSQEVEFPSVMGKRIMMVTALPEFNEDQYLESVLIVSHDITDRKQIELEVQAKNKKITESINYAKRIQVSLLPDTSELQSDFPDSFILYKPRDVVSGDFPWICRNNGHTYIAAVDCTGHGVPGALISLIGHFLLNNVANDDIAPARILDQLDHEMARTLRQNGSNGAATRDGMDIGLVRINKKEKILEFAGAHRPLFLLKRNSLEEIKGDKFPIGGGQYKNREAFNNYEIAYEPGDSLILLSDGYPDQFGGPENKKFTPGRLRELLGQHYNTPMHELHRVLDEEFESWKGTFKQTDDVLVIGIRLN